MKSIGVCIVANGNYVAVKTCIGNLIEKSNGANLRFYILDNLSKDIRIHEYCKTICEGYASVPGKKYFHESTERLTGYSAYNKIMSQVEEDCVCLFPTDILVNDNWAIDMLVANEEIAKAGIVAIRTERDKTSLTPLLAFNDKMIPVWRTPDNSVRGVCLFNRDIMRVIGGYDKELFGTGYEQDEFCFRFSANGYNNFYITGQNCIKVHEDEIKTETGAQLFKATIDEMKKNRNYKKQF